MLLWGTWAFLPKISTRTLDARSVLVFQNLGAFSMALVILASARFKLKFHPAGISWAILTGTLGVLGLLCYLQAVARQSIAIVVMVTALYPVVTVALSVLVLKDRISNMQWLGILFALCSLACMSWPSK
jgi:transporter family protein